VEINQQDLVLLDDIAHLEARLALPEDVTELWA
jgi:hypothetical protein